MKYKGIALVGRAWAGKTTVAAMLANCGFVRCSFAFSLKKAVWELWGNPGDRKLLQQVGTVLRGIDPEVFVRRCVRDVRYFTKRNIAVVVDDVRYENEAEALRREGFMIVGVIRPGVRDPAAGDHSSETEQDHIPTDFTIVNDGGRADLHKKTMEAINDW